MKNKKDRDDIAMERILAKLDQNLAYQSVHADNDDWWFRIMVDMAVEGKITRDEVTEIGMSARIGKNDERIG